MDIDLPQYVAGGYFIIKSVRRDPDRSPDLLPERLISLSGCICPSVHVYWAWSDQEALAFGIPESKLPDTHREFPDFDYPNVFLKLETARAFVEEFLPATDDGLQLVGAGLHRDLVDDFLTLRQQAYDPHTGSTIEEIIGVSRAVSQRKLLEPGGQPLGFEVVGYEQSLGHSWLCSGLERDMFDQFGIRPNKNGLIHTHDEAMRVYRWIAEDEQRGRRAEPEPYTPWLLVAYPAN